MHILLVEDEPNIARPVVRALEAQGHRVRHADTLEGARHLLQLSAYKEGLAAPGETLEVME